MESLTLKGTVAQLITRDTQGVRIGSKLVFQPSQRWRIPEESDDLGQIEYTDPEQFVKEFGEATLEKVMQGELVQVATKPTPDLSFRGGPVRTYRKVTTNVIYPIKGTSELLTSSPII